MLFFTYTVLPLYEIQHSVFEFMLRNWEEIYLELSSQSYSSNTLPIQSGLWLENCICSQCKYSRVLRHVNELNIFLSWRLVNSFSSSVVPVPLKSLGLCMSSYTATDPPAPHECHFPGNQWSKLDPLPQRHVRPKDLCFYSIPCDVIKYLVVCLPSFLYALEGRVFVCLLSSASKNNRHLKFVTESWKNRL